MGSPSLEMTSDTGRSNLFLAKLNECINLSCCPCQPNFVVVVVLNLNKPISEGVKHDCKINTLERQTKA